MPRAESYFDDTYTGPRWRYGLSLRPLGPYNVPDGAIIGSWDRDGRFAYGTVAYPRELTREECDHYDLTWIWRGDET